MGIPRGEVSGARTFAYHCPSWNLYKYSMINARSTPGVVRIRYMKKLIERVIQIESSTGIRQPPHNRDSKTPHVGSSTQNISLIPLSSKTSLPLRVSAPFLLSRNVSSKLPVLSWYSSLYISPFPLSTFTPSKSLLSSISSS